MTVKVTKANTYIVQTNKNKINVQKMNTYIVFRVAFVRQITINSM